VRDTGGELAHGREPLRVAELLESRDAGRGLVHHPPVRLRDPVAHRVDLRRELPHLVPLRQDERPREVAGARASRLVAEAYEGTADEPELKRDREQRADGDHRDRRTEDGEMAHADERLLVPQRLGGCECGRVRGGPHLRPGV